MSEHRISAVRAISARLLAGAVLFAFAAGGCASRVKQARDLHTAGRTGDAVALLEAAVRDDPADVEARLELAAIVRAAGDPLTAEDHLRAALEQQPERVDILLRLASVLEELGSLGQAAHQLGRARDLGGAEAVADERFRELLVRAAARRQLQADHIGAIELIRRGIAEGLLDAEEHRGQLEAAWASQANSLVARERKEQAVAAWEEAERLDPKQPIYPLARGKLLADLNRPIDARKAFDDYIQRAAASPDDRARAAVRVGEWYASRDATSTAAAYYEEAVALGPGDAKLHLVLAELRLTLRDEVAGKRSFERFLGLRGRSAKALRLAAHRCRQLGARSLAESYYEEALRLDPRDFDAVDAIARLRVARGARDEARAVMKAYLAGASDRAEAAFRVGSWAVKQDDLELAASAYEESAKLRPARTITFLRLADVYERQAQRARADEALRRFVKASPDRARALGTVADRLRTERRFDEAAAHLRKAIARLPSDAHLLRSLARVHREAGRPDDEARAREAYVRVAPDRASALLEVGRDYERRAQLDRALSFLVRAAGVGPVDQRMVALDNIGDIRRRTGDLQGMKAADDRLVALAGDDAERMRAYQLLAKRYKRARLWDRYIWALTEQVRLVPDRSGIHLKLGKAHLLRANKESAAAAFRRFVAGSKDKVLALNGVGRLYQEQGDSEAALAAFRRIQEVAPGDVRYLGMMADLYDRRDDRERAARLYDQLLDTSAPGALDLKSLARRLFRGKYHAQAARALERLFAEQPMAGAPALHLGVCYLELRRSEEARAAFNAYLASRGEDPASHLDVARQYRDRRHFADAIRHFRLVLETDGRNIHAAYTEAADVLIQIADKEGLAEITKRYLGRAKNELRARERAAERYALAGMPKEAVTEWRRILAIRPNHEAALKSLVDLLYSMGRAEDASKYVERLILERGDRPDNWHGAANAMKAKGGYEAALRFYDRAAKSGSSQQLHFERAEILLALGRWGQAKAAVERAITSAHSSRSSLERAGKLWERFDRPAETEELWLRATSSDPTHPDHYASLAAVQLQRGELRRARRTLLAARGSAPSARFQVALRFEAHGYIEQASTIYEQVLERGIDEHRKEAFVRLGAIWLARGRADAMAPVTQRFVKNSRDRPEARRLVAKLFASAGRFDDAFVQARMAARESPGSEVMKELARYALLGGRDEAALDALVRRTREGDDGEDLAAEAAEALVGWRRVDLALALVDRLELSAASGDRPSLASARLRMIAGDSAAGFAALDDFLEAAGDRTEALGEAAKLLVERGFLTEAAELLEEASSDPDSAVMVLADLAEIRFELGDQEGGTEAIRRYLAKPLGSDTAEERAFIAGATLRGGGRAEEAAARLSEAVHHSNAKRAGYAFRFLVLAELEARAEAGVDRALETFLSARQHTVAAYLAAAKILGQELFRVDRAAALVREATGRFPGEDDFRDIEVHVSARLDDEEALKRAIDSYLTASGSRPIDDRLRGLARDFEGALRYEAATEQRLRLHRLQPGDRRSLHSAARTAYSGGDPAAAERLLRDYVAMSADAADASRRAAGMYIGFGDGPAALSFADRAVEASPGDARSHYVRFVAALLADQVERADEALTAYLDAAPDKHHARLVAARRLLYRGDVPTPGARLEDRPERLGRAMELLEALSGTRWIAAEARLWTDLVGAVLGLEGARPRAAAHASAGPAALVRDQLDRRAMAQRPAVPALVADVLLAVGASEGVNEALDRWALTSDKPDQTLRAAFELCRGRERHDLALRWLDQLDERFPDNPSKVTLLAEGLEGAGDVEGAEAAYRAALARHPRHGVYMNNLAYLLSRQGRNLPEALKLVRRAEVLQPESSKFYYDTEGWVLYRMGRLGEARDRIRSSIRLMDPRMGSTVSESFFHLGMVERDLGNTDAARRAFRLATAVDRHGNYGRKSRAELERLIAP